MPSCPAGRPRNITLFEDETETAGQAHAAYRILPASHSADAFVCVFRKENFNLFASQNECANRVNREGFTGKGERVDGTSSSRAGIATRRGRIAGGLQNQLMNPESVFRNKIPETLRP
jgi:hypothetical protein